MGVGKNLERRKPIKADWSDILEAFTMHQYTTIRTSSTEADMLIHPVCRPKYKLVKHSRHPMSSPDSAARNWTSAHRISLSSSEIENGCHSP